VAFAVACPNAAQAQYDQLINQAMSQAGMGGTSMGSTGSMGSSGAGGSSGMFGSRSPGSGTLSPGQRTLSGNGQGGANGASSAGQMQGNERFLRNNRRPGQFVGASSQQSNFLSQTGGRGLQNLNIRNNNQQDDPNRNNQMQQNQRQHLTVRYEAGFPSPLQTNVKLSESLQKTLKSPKLPSSLPITVVMNGRTAILTGQVQSEHVRDLAERVVALEPGIDQVQNDLQVAAAAPVQGKSPAGRPAGLPAVRTPAE